MGIFDFEETEERKLGVCMYCGKVMVGEVGIESGEIKIFPGAKLKDGTFICDECVESKGLYASDINNKTKGELIAIFKEKGFVLPDAFTSTKRVHRVGAPLTGRSNYMYLESDEERKLLNVPIYEQGIFGEKVRDCVIPWADIIDFNVVDNGTQISNLDTIASGRKYQNRPFEGICTSLLLQIVTPKNSFCINFIGKGLDYDKLDRTKDDKYHRISNALSDCLDILKGILADKLEEKIIEIKEAEEKVKIMNKNKEMTKVGMKQCPNCKTKYGASVKFCSSCGALLEEIEGDIAAYEVETVEPVTTPSISSPSNAEMHEWVLKTTFGRTGTKVTEIKTSGSQISIDQYKRFIIKWARKKANFDVRDIVRLERTKKLSGNSVIGIIFGAALLLAGVTAGYMPLIIISVLVLVINAVTLHENLIIIHYQHGRVKMPDDRIHNSDIEDFFTFIRKYNPSAVKTFVE